jgi:hypothetical protein
VYEREGGYRALLATPAFAFILDKLICDKLDAAVTSHPHQREERETAYHEIRALRELRGVITSLSGLNRQSQLQTDESEEAP